MDTANIAIKKTSSTNSNILSSHHKFLWDENNDAAISLENQIAKNYHDQLFKEYCISDMTHYMTNQIALRWRTKKEVISGKGEYICGDKNCNSIKGLKSWEVNFKYTEHGKKMNTLVKLNKVKKESNIYKNVELESELIKDSSMKSSINETCKDHNDYISKWNIESFKKIDMNISKKIDVYLQDLFQWIETT
ncbi:PREDICTED: protein FRA10AC1 homolog [Ceratosolen solmsi marchali]|uniref:Protein FRA10AC1 homolog n=1 Tax=Ceratosolen solmsi marchali TaxID=326594 RepID=A0AAJ7DYW8_9HYME|nr:PREDICTED: protein FRA10AC1 homolog [Ceratosolen solmsi marchali]